MYFVEEWQAYYLAKNYARFWQMLTGYRMYCAGNLGKNQEDYLFEFNHLKMAFLSVDEDAVVDEFIKSPVRYLFQNIEKILSKTKFNSEDTKQIANLLYEFEKEMQASFNEKYLKEHLQRSREMHLPKGMHPILKLLENDEFNSAIIDTFKYLDWILQSSLKVSPHEYYGEDIINLAFSPRNGKMQLNTHRNEQEGIRNLASGLYALFRNPAAHRNIFDENNGIIRMDGDEHTAAAVFEMVIVIVRLVYENTYRDIDEKIKEELIKIASKYKWDQKIIKHSYGFQYYWGIISDKNERYKSLHNCGVIIKLAEDANGIYLQIFLKEKIENGELETLINNIREKSNLRTIFEKNKSAF